MGEDEATVAFTEPEVELQVDLAENKELLEEDINNQCKDGHHAYTVACYEF